MSRLAQQPRRTDRRGLWDAACAAEAKKQLKLQDAAVPKEHCLGIERGDAYPAVMQLSPRPTRGAKDYSRRKASYFSLSHLQNGPVEREWVVSSDRRGRGRGMYGPAALRDSLSAHPTAQCCSDAAVNHPSLLTVRRHYEDVAEACVGCGSRSRQSDRVSVGYHLESHWSGGVASQPVGYRFRLEEEAAPPAGLISVSWTCWCCPRVHFDRRFAN
ncbi:hypothetical protein LSM04_002910 [Trypanosoma melophagium]|uniref:uncharacterized protein n=1 Tax=Trypanosoma melophagium TaxID=715481 RepID=UPI00351A6BEF|nr:hypothetical protein LSM04_002910 [Trypanosoma melophagium]